MFRELPTVLVDLITGFAWGMCFDDVFIRACIAVADRTLKLAKN